MSGEGAGISEADFPNKSTSLANSELIKTGSQMNNRPEQESSVTTGASPERSPIELSRAALLKRLLEDPPESDVPLGSGRFTRVEILDRQLLYRPELEDREFLQQKIDQTLVYLLDHSEDFHYLTPLFAKKGAGTVRPNRKVVIPDEASEADTVLEFIDLWFPTQALVSLARLENLNETKRMLGMFVDRESLPVVIQRLRNLLSSEGRLKLHNLNNDQGIAGLQRIGKILLGLSPDDPRDFITSLQEAYEKLDFDSYPTNLEATERETDMIISLIRGSGRKNIAVAEIGSGTGRIPNRLAQETLDGEVARIIGIDPDSNLLEQARQADTTGKVEYHAGTLEEPHLEHKSLDAIIVIGRTLTHLRNKQEFIQAFIKISEALKDDGMVIFDLPANDKGVYLENRKTTARVLRDLHIPITEDEALRYYDQVLDSPEQSKPFGERNVFYDRYVPDLEKPYRTGSSFSMADEIYEATGVKIEKSSEAPIYGWEGATNYYYVGRVHREKDPYADVDEHAFDQIDLMKADNELLLTLPPPKYAAFLRQIEHGDSEEALKRMAVITTRFSRDLSLPPYRTADNREKMLVASEIAEATERIFWRLSLEMKYVEPAVLENVYEAMHHANPIVAEYAMKLVPHLIRMDLQTRELRGNSADFLDLQGRFNGELEERLSHLEDRENRGKALGMLRAGWSHDLLKERIMFLFEKGLSQAKTPDEAFSLCYLFSEPFGNTIFLPEVRDEIMDFLDSEPQLKEKYGEIVMRELLGVRTA